MLIRQRWDLVQSSVDHVRLDERRWKAIRDEKRTNLDSNFKIKILHLVGYENVGDHSAMMKRMIRDKISMDGNIISGR
jgi:hypothetical protein